MLSYRGLSVVGWGVVSSISVVRALLNAQTVPQFLLFVAISVIVLYVVVYFVEQVGGSAYRGLRQKITGGEAE